MDKTDEFSFILKPSTISGAGVGVFATHNIAKDTSLALFPNGFASIRRKGKDLPQIFKEYSIAEENDIYRTPAKFNQMEIGWYLNHSSTPNAGRNGGEEYRALREIKEGEEILIDYNILGEPEDKKENYYRV